MPREHLLGLVADAERLLAAGAVAGVGNEKLLRRARTLRELGGKVPALAATADAVERLTGAEPLRAGPALLDLLQATRQLRAGLAVCGIEGELEPAPESGPWRTPLAARGLGPAREFPTDWAAALRVASGGADCGDLRLVASLLRALDEGSDMLAAWAAETGVPALGQAILPELLGRLRLDGAATDARRLRAVCKIDAAVAAELCRRALGLGGGAKGSLTVMASAIRCLADVAPAEEAARTALVWARASNRDLRAGAVASLRVGRSDAALDTLVRALDDADESVRAAAGAALARSDHPQAVERLRRELEGAVRGLHEEADAALHLRRAVWLIRALAGRPGEAERRQAVFALLPLTSDADEQLRGEAFQALAALGPVTEEAVPALLRALERGDRSAPAARDALARAVEVWPDRVAPGVFAALRGSKFRAREAVEFVRPLLPALAARLDAYREPLRQLLQSGDAGTDVAAECLALAGPAARDLLPDLVGRLGGNRPASFYAVFARLDEDGTAGLPLLIEALRSRDARVRDQALRAISPYGLRGRAAVDAVKALLFDSRREVRERARETLKALAAD
jgi:HEAT repeat protein